jgi:hypothetical protein
MDKNNLLMMLLLALGAYVATDKITDLRKTPAVEVVVSKSDPIIPVADSDVTMRALSNIFKTTPGVDDATKAADSMYFALTFQRVSDVVEYDGTQTMDRRIFKQKIQLESLVSYMGLAVTAAPFKERYIGLSVPIGSYLASSPMSMEQGDLTDADRVRFISSLRHLAGCFYRVYMLVRDGALPTDSAPPVNHKNPFMGLSGHPVSVPYGIGKPLFTTPQTLPVYVVRPLDSTGDSRNRRIASYRTLGPLYDGPPKPPILTLVDPASV